MSMSPERLKQLLEESRKKLAAQQAGPTAQAESTATQTAAEVVRERIEEVAESDDFQWNPEQLVAIALARNFKTVPGSGFCLIGAAGTGKTTTEKEITRVLVSENIVDPLEMSTKYLAGGSPGILVTSFTRRAVRNSRRVLPPDLQGNCLTLHKVLEFEPVFYEVWDEVAQEMRKTMRFEPMRNRQNPLPHNLRVIIIDESSMVSVDLFKQLLDALPDPSKVSFIFVGDLHQLPPVYGQAILGFKLLELPTVELTRIYRQARKSPIISLAHQIKNGEDIPVTAQIVTENEQGKVTIRPWKKALSDFDAAHTASAFLKQLVSNGDYNEEEDIILCPQEKVKNLAFGTNEFNRTVAQILGEKRNEGKGAVVYEIIAGYEKHYYAVGDRILVGREDAIITKISRNAKYWGKRPRPASIDLDRWGNYKRPVKDEDGDDFDVDKYLEQFTLESNDKDKDRKQESSHIIDVELLDSGASETLNTAGEINATQFAYCLTVHKSQGSEWNRVFFLTHQSHVVMWNRELLYTAITRARKELYLIVEPDRKGKHGTLTKAAKSPRIKGDTLAEKAEYFKGKQAEYQDKISKGNDVPVGTPRAGQYKGAATQQKPMLPATPEKPPLKIVRFAELVSGAFRDTAQKKLDELWERAKIIWGEGKIGTKPEISYNLQSSRVIGLASYLENQIKLNAVWCVVADKNPQIWHEMINDTIPHELAHFINQHYSTPRGKGHDGGWMMAAKLLGMPNPEATTSEFPQWAEGLREAMRATVREINENLKNSEGSELDLSDDVVITNESMEA